MSLLQIWSDSCYVWCSCSLLRSVVVLPLVWMQDDTSPRAMHRSQGMLPFAGELRLSRRKVCSSPAFLRAFPTPLELAICVLTAITCKDLFSGILIEVVNYHQSFSSSRIITGSLNTFYIHARGGKFSCDQSSFQ